MAVATARRARPRELAPNPKRAARLNAVVLAAALLAGCRGGGSGANVDLVLPEGVGTRVELTPRAAFAEYVELPELRRELRITLANYELGCERYVPPGPNELLFVLTIATPEKEPVGVGTIPFGGAPAPDAGVLGRKTAFAVARQGDRGFDFPSGGTVELSSVDLSASGRVSGALGLEFPGDGTRPAAGAHGKFEARMCRGE
jgi:hypothetical protein